MTLEETLPWILTGLLMPCNGKWIASRRLLHVSEKLYMTNYIPDNTPEWPEWAATLIGEPFPFTYRTQLDGIAYTVQGNSGMAHLYRFMRPDCASLVCSHYTDVKHVRENLPSYLVRAALK